MFQKKVCKYLIVDEVQDFSKAAIKAMVSMCESKENIVFIGDVAQSIYGGRFSWKHTGVKFDKRTNSFELETNFRNTIQVSKIANSLLENEYQMNIENVKRYTKMLDSRRDGETPTLYYCNNLEEQSTFAINEIRNILRNNPTQKINILLRMRNSGGLTHLESKILEDAELTKLLKISMDNRGKRKIKDLKHSEPVDDKIRYATFHSSKGVEFDNVIIIDVNDGVVPRRSEDMDEQTYAQERRLLYVAITRTKNKLVMCSVGRPSPFLSEISPELLQIVSRNTSNYLQNLNEKIQKHNDEIAKFLNLEKTLNETVKSLEAENQILTSQYDERNKAFLRIQQDGEIDEISDHGEKLSEVKKRLDENNTKIAEINNKLEWLEKRNISLKNEIEQREQINAL